MLLETDVFYLEYKASFIQISSIASFNSFLIAWLRGYCTFLDSSVVSLNPRLDPNTPNTEIFPPKKSCSTIKLFFFFKFVLRLFLANTKEKIGGHRACFLTNCCERWTWFWDRSHEWIICAAGTGARYKITSIVFEVCTRDQARLFLCDWYRQHRNSNLKRVQ